MAMPASQATPAGTPARPLRVFGLDGATALSAAVAASLGVPVSAHEDRAFEDGERKIRPLEAVANTDAWIVDSLHGRTAGGVDARLCRLLFFAAALHDHGAAHVGVALGYLCYGRKDRRTRAFDPLASRYVAQLMEAVGIDRVVALDVHNPAAFDNAFRCPALRMDAAALLCGHLAPLLAGREVVVVSPDTGGVARAEACRQLLSRQLGHECDGGLMEKRRGGGVVEGSRLYAEVAGRTVVLFDDMVVTGSTLLRAARAARAAGAEAVWAAATHGVFAGHAALLSGTEIGRLVVTDSIDQALPAADGTASAVAAWKGRLEVLPCAPLLAAGIASF